MPSTPPGLKLAFEAVTPAEEVALIAAIEASEPAASPYDPGNPRSSSSFGWKYDYASDSFRACAPMPALFERIAERAAAFAGIAADDIVECLLNRYAPGAVIQPHIDKPVWEHVIGLSLGTEAPMRFSEPAGGEAIDVPLPPRSIYLLAGDARYAWQHSLPPLAETRWSITFRTLSAEGARRRAGTMAAS